MNLEIPKANYIQIGLNQITKIIREEKITEGDLIELSEEQIQKPTIKFVDLFWFHNEAERKFSNQLELVTLGINLNFGNVRINGYLNIQDSIHNQAIFITQDLLTVNAAVYPTGLFHVRHLKNGEIYRPMEQLFVQYDPEKEPWHDELPRTFFQKQNDMVKMGIEKGNEDYFYIFRDRQYELFNYALDFVLNNGFKLVASKK